MASDRRRADKLLVRNRLALGSSASAGDCPRKTSGLVAHPAHSGPTRQTAIPRTNFPFMFRLSLKLFDLVGFCQT